MKKWILAGLLTISVRGLHAQSFGEWFKQKQTQISYLEEQIAALKAYGNIVQKGYELAHNGLEAIAISREGDFKMHSGQFLSLRKVKPVIANNGMVHTIMSMREEIKKELGLIQPLLSTFFTPGETAYGGSVFKNLITACNELTDDLSLIITDDRLALKDDERIERIHSIYIRMLDRYSFCRSFENELKLFALQKLKEKKEVSELSKLYGIK